MTRQSDTLWIAAISKRGRLRTAVVRPDQSYIWDTGVAILEVDCVQTPEDTYAVARATNSEPGAKDTRLQPDSTNVVGTFRVRVYRNPISISQAQEDFR